MPSIRTGQRYSAGPSMPSSSTLRQGSYASSPSSTTSNSILRSVSPYQRQERVPTSPYKNMEESLTMMTTMKALWQYSTNKVIFIQEQ